MVNLVVVLFYIIDQNIVCLRKVIIVGFLLVASKENMMTKKELHRIKN